jgi:holo-[acyl-carrier protein] synthase
MLRTGVDLVEIDRFAQALERHGERLAARVFTLREREQCADRVASLAARFAAKEAVAKALGTGIGAVRWVDIEVLTNAAGAPYLILHEEAARRAAALGLSEWAISLSHSRGCAAAVAVASGESQSA